MDEVPKFKYVKRLPDRQRGGYKYFYTAEYSNAKKAKYRAERKLMAKRLLQAAKSILQVNPYNGPYQTCTYCGRSPHDFHTDDCLWLQLKRETLAYENRHL